MIRVKREVNILALLKECGLSQYALREQHLIGQSRIQSLRHGALPTQRELDLICRTTGANVGDLLEYVAE